MRFINYEWTLIDERTIEQVPTKKTIENAFFFCYTHCAHKFSGQGEKSLNAYTNGTIIFMENVRANDTNQYVHMYVDRQTIQFDEAGYFFFVQNKRSQPKKQAH